MSVSRETRLTHELTDAITRAEPEDALRSLVYLIRHACNTIAELGGERAAAALEHEALFVQERAEQTRATVPPPDPDGDLL